MRKKPYKKLTINLAPQTEHALRVYVAKTYPIEPFGKLSQVVNRAVDEFLKKEGA